MFFNDSAQPLDRSNKAERNRGTIALHFHNRCVFALSVALVCVGLAAPRHALAQSAGCEASWIQNNPSGEGSVTCVATAMNGDLLVAGRFTSVGGVAANNIARWDGLTWHALGSGIQVPYPGSRISRLTSLPGGTIVAAGKFICLDDCSQPVGGVFRWDGTSWAPLGVGGPRDAYAMLRLRNGDLFVGGGLRSTGTSISQCAARWDGVSWTSISVPGIADEAQYGGVGAIAEMPNGDVLVSSGWSAFVGAGTWHSGYSLSTWTGTTWVSIPYPPQYAGHSLAIRQNGDIVASGDGYYPSYVYVYRSNSQTWYEISHGGYSVVDDMFLDTNGEIVMLGYLPEPTGLPATPCVCRWDGNGSNWHLVSADIPGNAFSLTKLANGNLVVGGYISLNVPFLATLGPPPPTITSNPSNQSSCRGGSASFGVAASGVAPVSYRWQVAEVAAAEQWRDLADGPLIVRSRVVAAISGAATSSLQCRLDSVLGVGASNLALRCVVSDSCASSASGGARLLVCAADVDDGSGTGSCDGGVTVDDLLFYLSLFAANLPGADLDDGSATGTPDGGIGIEDLLYFLARYNVGC